MQIDFFEDEVRGWRKWKDSNGISMEEIYFDTITTGGSLHLISTEIQVEVARKCQWGFLWLDDLTGRAVDRDLTRGLT